MKKYVFIKIEFQPYQNHIKHCLIKQNNIFFFNVETIYVYKNYIIAHQYKVIFRIYIKKSKDNKKMVQTRKYHVTINSIILL